MKESVSALYFSAKCFLDVIVWRPTFALNVDARMESWQIKPQISGRDRPPLSELMVLVFSLHSCTMAIHATLVFWCHGNGPALVQSCHKWLCENLAPSFAHWSPACTGNQRGWWRETFFKGVNVKHALFALNGQIYEKEGVRVKCIPSAPHIILFYEST